MNPARLPFAAQKQLLDGIVARCRAYDRKGHAPALVVFDLDGTLMDNRPRTLAIMQELAHEWAQKDPSLALKLQNAKPDELEYLFGDTLKKLGVTREDLLSDGEAFWKARFFRDPHLEHDIALAGSVSFAKDLYEAGVTLVYLTGRDLPFMGLGTFKSLRDLGFPIGVPGTEFILKPDAAMPDEVFKRELAPQLSRIGNTVAAFDNEPGNCNVFLQAYPECDSVLVDTQMMPGPPPLLAGVKVVADFAR
ncbi:MAG: haloacid dehalogenase-like hydrolase [Polyangiaceae bacterium]